MQQRVGYGGLLVEPGEIVVAEGDGVAVIPHHLAAEVAKKGAEQERMETWIKQRIESGTPVAGLYPPGERTMAEYRSWKAKGRPEGGGASS